MGIGSSKEHIFYIKKKKNLTNNLGYREIPCLETFCKDCAVFIRPGKVYVWGFFLSVACNIGKDYSSS